jgi:hypothetical protein
VVAFNVIPVGNAGLTAQLLTDPAAPKVAASVVVKGLSTVALGSEVVEMSMYLRRPLGVPEVKISDV